LSPSASLHRLRSEPAGFSSGAMVNDR
jgi:hypothetical protein